MDNVSLYPFSLAVNVILAGGIKLMYMLHPRVGGGSFANRYITVESLHPQGLEDFEQMDFVAIALEANAVVFSPLPP